LEQYGLVSPAGSVGSHQRPTGACSPFRTLRVPQFRAIFSHRRKPKKQLLLRLSLAGAEGLEPSARGFGVDVEKLAGRIAAGFFGGVEPFPNPNPTPRNFLMLY